MFRRRRADVGVFEPPPTRPLTPAQQVIADALAISFHAVKMTVKNQLIVNALRDERPFDHAALTDAARDEYRRLAAASRSTAARLQERLRREDADDEDWEFPGGKSVEIGQEQRRGPTILNSVAAAMEAASRESETLDRVVSDAKAAAWDEIGGALAQRLVAAQVVDDPDYLAKREERIQAFIREELSGLTGR